MPVLGLMSGPVTAYGTVTSIEEFRVFPLRTLSIG
jgi:hypothetical protein